MQKRKIAIFLLCVFVAVAVYAGWTYQNDSYIWQTIATDASCFGRDGNKDLYPMYPAVYENTVCELNMGDKNALPRTGYWTMDISSNFYPNVTLGDYAHRGELGYKWDANWNIDTNGNVYPK